MKKIGNIKRKTCSELISMIFIKLFCLALAIPAFFTMWLCSFRVREETDYRKIRAAHEKKVRMMAKKARNQGSSEGLFKKFLEVFR